MVCESVSSLENSRSTYRLEHDPLQLFHFDNQGAACSGFGDHRPLTGENEKMTSNLIAQQSVGACEMINGETIALELESGRKATGGLVQTLRAGFVPPEPSSGSELEKTSRYNFGTFEDKRKSGLSSLSGTR